MSKIHPFNLKQAKAIIRQYGHVYLHGDGNMFFAEEASKFRRTFSNPDQPEATIWIKFTSETEVPDTIEEAERLMENNKKRQAKEDIEKKKTGAEVVGFDMDELPEHLQPRKKAADTDGPTLEDLQKTHADLLEKDSFLTSKEQSLRNQAAHIDNKNAAISDAEKEIQEKTAALDTKANELIAIENKLRQMEEDLNKKAAELAKKAPKS